MNANGEAEKSFTEGNEGNEDIKSRITYSVKLPRINPDDMKAFLYDQPILEQLGYRLEPRANGNYAITGQRCGEIVIKDHYWNCPGTELAGNAIDFLIRIHGATFHEAMQQLTLKETVRSRERDRTAVVS